MAHPHPREVVRHIRRLATTDETRDTTDGDLLRAFLADHDQPAFAEIIRRHGPMAMSVCRRVLGNDADAEDAFQATFLLLARKAGSVRKHTSLGSWLHGVAFRMAGDVRKTTLRRRQHENRASSSKSEDPARSAMWKEIQSLLDEEIANLPTLHREAFILCCLENQSCADVAARLGVKEGTVWSRVSGARERLRKRLSLRGISLAALLGAVAVSGNTAWAMVRSELADTTAKAAAGVGGGEALAAVCSPRVIALVEGMGKVMSVTKLAGGAVILLLAGALATGLGVVAQQPSDQPANPPPRDGQEKPRTDHFGDPLPPGAVARLGTVRLRATAMNMSLTPDGKSLITVSGGRTIGRWEAETGRLLSETHLPGPFAFDTWLSPDGSLLAIAEDKKLSLWDTATGKRLQLFSVNPNHVAFSSDSKSLATAAYESGNGKIILSEIRLWDVAAGTNRKIADLSSYTNDLAFDPKGERLFAAVDNHSLRCWNLATGKQLWEDDHAASRITVSPDGRTLVTDTYLGRPLNFWDAETGKCKASVGDERLWAAQLIFAPDGKSLVQVTPHAARIWNLESHKIQATFETDMVRAVFAPDGKSLFTLGPMLLRWDIATNKLLYTDTRADGHIGPVSSVAFAPDGKTLASCGNDGTIRIWERASGKHRVLRKDGPVGGCRQVGGENGFRVFSVGTIQFTPDGKQLVTDADAGTLALTDVASGKEVRRFSLPTQKDKWMTVASARLTADGRTLLASGHTTEPPTGGGSKDFLQRKEPVLAWDLATGQEVLAREVPSSGLNSGSQFSFDGRLYYPACNKKVYDIWGEGEPVATHIELPGYTHHAVAFSPDGRLLAVPEPSEDGIRSRSVQILEILTGRVVARFEVTLSNTRTMTFSPDNRLLALSGTDALHVWDCATGQERLHLEARGRLTNWPPSVFAHSLAFAPDGNTLATGHGDGTILLWDLTEARKKSAPAAVVDVAACWKDLTGADASKAYLAVERLASAPEAALRLLRQEVKPLTVDQRQVMGWLTDLDSNDFETREAASRELKKVAAVVETDVRGELERTKSPEVRRRLQQVLEALALTRTEAPPPETVRDLRALLVLERIGNSEARTLLTELNKGAKDARLTREARQILDRLERVR